MTEALPERLYKVTWPGGLPCNGGTGQWRLPMRHNGEEWHPGQWRTVKGGLSMCNNGLHVVSADHLAEWVKDGAQVWAVEVDRKRDVKYDSHKWCVQRARLLLPVGGVLTAHDVTMIGRGARRWLHEHDPRLPSIGALLVFGVDRLDPEEANAAPAWQPGVIHQRSDGRWYRLRMKARRERPDVWIAAKQKQITETPVIRIVPRAAA